MAVIEGMGRFHHVAPIVLELGNAGGLAPNVHETHEVIYVMSGRYRVRIGDAEWLAGPGDVCCYPAETAHWGRAELDARTTLMLLQWWPSPGETFPVVPCRGHDAGARLLFALTWLHEMATDAPPRGTACETLLDLFVDELERLVHGEAEMAADPVQRVIANMRRTTFYRNHTLVSLARTADMTPSRFCRLFRRRTGVSPMQYLQQLRVEAALPLITTTQLPFSEVAARVGLGSASYLWRLVMRRYGRSPRELRAQGDGGQDAPRNAPL